MAEWQAKTVRDAVTEISEEKIVLPVIQRRLEWNSDKMEMLFDSLFRQNSFGSIICIEEEKGFEPLFAHRLFTRNGSYTSSVENDTVSGRNLLLVIDGQQRLQSFYMGLCGTIDGKTLYYDLFSDYKARDYDFKFAFRNNDLPSKNPERTKIGRCLWYSVPYLFSALKKLANPDLLADRIIREKGVTDADEQKHIEKNVGIFYARIFADKSVGMSEVAARMSDDVNEDRQRITELFRRLNFEGMKLSIYDLVASKLKSFDYKMENFLDEVTAENAEVGIDQDVLIKLLLVLHDKPGTGAADLTIQDAEFATENSMRIRNTLYALKSFLHYSGDEKWFDVSKKSAIKKSAIPLYFLAYHIFHSRLETEKLPDMFSMFDTGSEDFRSMSLWLKLSLLNQLFSRGCGWRPESTGIRKLHEVMSRNKGGLFPAQEIFTVYRKHPLTFFDASEISPDKLDSLNQEYIFYLIYGDGRSSLRTEDKDHIQPQSLLECANASPKKINSIGNLVLIDYRTNRVSKRDKELKDWLTSIPDKNEYMKRHLIPEDSELWKFERFDDFLRARLQLITDKIKSSL